MIDTPPLFFFFQLSPIQKELSLRTGSLVDTMITDIFATQTQSADLGPTFLTEPKFSSFYSLGGLDAVYLVQRLVEGRSTNSCQAPQRADSENSLHQSPK